MFDKVTAAVVYRCFLAAQGKTTSLVMHVAMMLMRAAAACCSAGLLDAALCCGRESHFQMAQLTLACQGSTGREALQQHLLQGMSLLLMTH